jgi:hypothetical protein
LVLTDNPLAAISLGLDPVLRDVARLGQPRDNRVSSSGRTILAATRREPHALAGRVFVRRHHTLRENVTLPGGPAASHDARLRCFQSDGRGFALIASLKLVAELLPLVEIANARSFDSRDVDKHVLRAIVGLNEAIALLGVEPFHGSGSHRLPFKVYRPALTIERRINHWLFAGGGSALFTSYEMRAEPKVDLSDVVLPPRHYKEAVMRSVWRAIASNSARIVGS